MKTVTIKTFGCRLNQAESEQIISGFEQAGYCYVPDIADADIYIIHTCTVTGTAENKCMQEARRIRRTKPSALIVLAGCAVENNPRLLEQCGADLQVGQQDKFRIHELLKDSLSPHFSDDNITTQKASPRRSRALLKIQTGCNFRCAYCIVPDVRGQPKSRDFKTILTEAERMISSGFHEIVVTGVNIGLYQTTGGGLVELLQQLAALPGIGRLRISSLEITTVEYDLIELIAKTPAICAFLHCPLQSGSDKLLKAMGRRYTTKEFSSFIRRAAGMIPDIGIGTDIICGYPGETNEDYKATCELVESLPFSNLHVFPFSPRPGTPAANITEELVPEKIIRQRCANLIDLGNRKRKTFVDSFTNKPVEILIEKVDNGIGRGWTAEYIKAEVPCSNDESGNLVRALADKSDGFTLLCRRR